MRSSFFKSNNEIHVRELEAPDTETFRISELVSVTTDYLNENYRGLFRFESEIGEGDKVRLCLYFLVKVFKKLAYVTRFEKLVNVNFSCNSNLFSIKLSTSDCERFERSCERELIKLARNAGFEVAFSGSGLLLSKEVFEPEILAVFTTPVELSVIREAYARLFSEEDQ